MRDIEPKDMKTISHCDFEIFKDSHRIHAANRCKWLVNDNAYISVVATNNCQCSCPYCINSYTDRSKNLPIDKAIQNIEKLSDIIKTRKGNPPEIIILGGEPTLHPRIFELIEGLTKLEQHHHKVGRVRLTTNGIKLRDRDFLKELIKTDLYGINISWHNDENFMPVKELEDIVNFIHSETEALGKLKKPVRINTNIYRGNHDNVEEMAELAERLSFADSIRISNIIHKDNFSVNSTNPRAAEDMALSDEGYEKLFTKFIESYEDAYSIFHNPNTLGFVKYYLIPTPCPIIVNWNINSKVSSQVCENAGRVINTFKCLVTGDISLSWNTDNIINLNDVN